MNTYYSSLSGMLAASYGLQNTSNNIANMQTPGFKRTDLFYSSLGSGSGDQGLGSGVYVGGHATNFSDGKTLSTNSPSDLAIVGPGFFVIRLKNNELAYTRNGEFGFNNEGILIDKHSGGEVQGYDAFGTLVPIHQLGPKTAAGKATHEVSLKGQFVAKKVDPNDPKSTYEHIKFSVAKIFDAHGKQHEFTLEFQSTSPDPAPLPGTDDGKTWYLVGIIDENGLHVNCDTGQKITFANDKVGSEDNSISCSLNGSQALIINFCSFKDGEDAVSIKDGKYSPGDSTKIDIHKIDGYGEGQQIGLSFDENGQVVYHYDNDQSLHGVYIGLARFDNLERELIPIHDSLFKTRAGEVIHFGRAHQDGFGGIQASKLESANVDSTVEFANIVILQRMFQACSQIMDIDKQLLEELESRS